MKKNIYTKISPPDYLCALDVTPDVSIQRKPDHNLTVIQAKSQAIAELKTINANQNKTCQIFYFNADRPFEEVLSQLKNKIWQVL